MKNDLKKEIIKCVCGKWTKPKIFHIEGFDIRGSECPKCGEAYLNGEDSFKLSEFRKIKNAILEGKISKSGNSYVVRLPINVIRALGLKKGESVKLKVKAPHEIIINVDKA
ncbi:MAG: AbrB/MazE/SpoVT family DNA-binding domain-containing protein [Thermoplasmata archaeon]|nr:MAG: AbrB/MazE/SpoVT family DNA-binding domain-containing protein [Thermoplasmata archaeon]